MDYERSVKLDNYTNTLVSSFKAFDLLPSRYKTLSYNHFLLLLAAKQLQDNNSGNFYTLDLMSITGLENKYLYKWLEIAINRGFINIPVEKSVFNLSNFGLLAVRQFRRNLWRLLNG